MKANVKQIWMLIIGIGLLVIIVCSIILVVFFPKFVHQASGEQNEAKTEFFAMDTYMTITAYGQNSEKALSDAKNKLTKLERLWSVTNPESDIYAVNHSNGAPVNVSEETVELLSFALHMAEETDGALEPTIYPVLAAWGFTTEENRVPSDSEIGELLQNVGYKRIRLENTNVQLERGMMLDMGSVGKGYAGDLTIQLLKDAGITSALLDLGGNIQALGSRPDGSLWRLGLRDPFSDSTLGVLEMSDQAVVTSGAYERYFIGEDGTKYGHIIDPVTGYPAESGLASVTVIAQEGRLCDALSTALYVMGRSRAIDYWQKHHNFEMILVTENGEICLTDGIADSFTLDSYHSNMKVQTIESHNN